MLEFFVIIHHHYHHHQCFLPKGRFFTAHSGTKAVVLPNGRPSTTTSGTQVSLGMNRGGIFPLLSTLHSLFRI